MRHVLLPEVGFLLFASGKLLTLFGLGSTMDFIDKGLYLNVFTNSCYFFLAHLPLHFLLAMYEQYLYLPKLQHFSSDVSFNPQHL